MRPLTFNLAHKGFFFSGVHSIEIDDEVKPEVVTIEKLYMDDNSRDVLSIIDPAIIYWLEDKLAER